MRFVEQEPTYKEHHQWKEWASEAKKVYLAIHNYMLGQFRIQVWHDPWLRGAERSDIILEM